jgi:predicted N-acetyltransferase YhbS
MRHADGLPLVEDDDVPGGERTQGRPVPDLARRRARRREALHDPAPQRQLALGHPADPMVSGMAPEIRRALPADLEPALRVMAQAFGTPYRTPSVHTLVAGAPEGHLFVAVHDGAVVVGTAASVSFGATAWLGGVTVAPEARGRRLGQALTEAALDALGDPRTISLLATPAGRPIYERLGFVPELEYRVFAVPDSAAPRTDGLVPAPPELVLALDREATGEDRALALAAGLERALATPDGAGVLLRPPFAARPILARTAEAGAALLTASLEPGLRLAAPAGNAAAMAAFARLAQPQRGVVRMRRGAPITWRPEQVWGVFSLFFG